MAQQYVTSAGTLTIPGSYATWTAATNNSGLSTAGVVVLIGEADSGPDFTLESPLNDNAFGTDQGSAVQAKYRSGDLVDAFRALSAPSNDPAITGTPSRVVLVKTNPSVRASSPILTFNSAAYSYLADKSYGKSGNLIYWKVLANQLEVLPTTGTFTWINNVAAFNATARVDGGAEQSLNMALHQTPAQAQAAFDGLSGVSATGGVLRTVLPGASGTLQLTANSNGSITVLYSGTFSNIPQPGDTLHIPTGSSLATDSDGGGTGDVATPGNIGAYIVVTATSNSVTATKLSDADYVSATVGIITPPVTKTAVSVGATTDMSFYSPITVSVDSVTTKLAGRTLEINEVAAGGGHTDILGHCAYTLSGSTIAPVGWISRTGAAYVITSAAEYQASLSVNRQSDNIQELLVAGGEIALKLGVVATSAQVVIDSVGMTFSTVGAASTINPIAFKDYPTLADLAQYIGSNSGWTCTLGNNLLGQLPSSALDQGTFTLASTFGAQTARLKIDAYRMFNKVSSESVLVRMQDSALATAGTVRAAGGLPAPTTSWTYLANGNKGHTTAATVTAAIDACQKVNCNFIVPLFSQDASLNVTAGLTESGSDYTVDAINDYLRTHVLAMSQLKRHRNRQGFPSKRDTFTNARTAASNQATLRQAMPFQDIKLVGTDGSIHQYHPWMASVLAAGMQAAGQYKGLVNKLVNISGAVQAAGDFDDQDDSAVENALISGLLPLKRDETGGWKWVSDQTTYGKDNNFIYNSIQAVYVADLIAMTSRTRMERAFVGQSVADISAPLAKAFLDTMMSDFMRLKFIAPSDDAPKGYKNAVIQLTGTTLLVSCEVKLAGMIYFVPISFVMSQVTQTA